MKNETKRLLRKAAMNLEDAIFHIRLINENDIDDGTAYALSKVKEELVARAICEAISGPWHMLSKPGKAALMREATAAIEAHIAALADAELEILPREPTKAMIAVGQEALSEEQTVSYIWRAMSAVYLK